jgi:YHS domain-containing protein
MNKKFLVFGVLFFAMCIVLGLTGCGKDDPAEDPKPADPAVKVDPVPVVAPEVPDVSGKVVAPAAVEAPKAVADPKALEDMLKTLDSGDEDKTEMLIKILEAAAKQKYTQVMCPVMAGEIKKDIFVEYKGKKVYFCCPPCKAKFNADPEKFLPKLPQFSK